MRKAEKKQAEDFIRLLGKAHSTLRKTIGQKNDQGAMELLAQCQEGAIGVGNLIEETEGEGFQTISMLEEYCEALYQLYEKISQKQFVNGNAEYKNLNRLLKKIEYSVKQDISVRTEAVFLPYKASMWDSLESVWRAASEDENCDAYVIPIPYYDKLPDGRLGQEHYEGEEYPDDVPVTRYDEYDFGKRRPDVIFIHNSYDECNYVTSVHPFFYSKNLKQYTEKLVYIPYFVLGEIDPGNQAAVEGIAHFVTVPGVIYADQVIVQSENMRQAYIQILKKHMGEREQGYWEEKILGLGSPKFDKVLNTPKEGVEAPEEWIELLRKPDGNWKKVILYNTGVTGLLRHDEKMLKKIRDVLRIFKKHRDEVALLWRPHPLLQATIASMRPQLWTEYQRIVTEYQQEGWGIYDETADLNRALALCDGYYGDASSLVQLCREAGKPVMVQDVEVLEG